MNKELRMTSQQQAELRDGIEAVVRASTSDVYRVDATNSPICFRWQDNIVGQIVGVRVSTNTVDADALPELTPLQHLALSVLLGDPDVPAAVLVGAIEDSGVWPDGAVKAMEEAVRMEERKRCADMVGRYGHDWWQDVSQDRESDFDDVNQAEWVQSECHAMGEAMLAGNDYDQWLESLQPDHTPA